jgi:hypothetical protein
MNTPNASRTVQRSKKENRMSDVSAIDGVGFAAAGLVLATFCMRSMSALRWVAIASNMAFIAYGYLDGLAPVLLLHVLLLPVNLCRLAQLRSAHGRSDPTRAWSRKSVARTCFGLDTGFRKRSCSKHDAERDDDSTESHLAFARATRGLDSDRHPFSAVCKVRL